MNSELEARIQRRERIFLAILQGHYACPDAPDHSHRVLVDNALLGAEEALSALDEADAKLRADALLDPGISDSVDAQRFRKLEAAFKSYDDLELYRSDGFVRLGHGFTAVAEGLTLGEAIDNLSI